MTYELVGDTDTVRVMHLAMMLVRDDRLKGNYDGSRVAYLMHSEMDTCEWFGYDDGATAYRMAVRLARAVQGCLYVDNGVAYVADDYAGILELRLRLGR